ncbi:glycohydrolase toxin TNT-related protein [uncultured Shewanella sp.]|uniref:glycohydrolase toxin TNT-related protein n=1 Tax=uncultured Shewanella sp. TaxID=173975 RepID=UPI00261664F0|nr:glycohydrolase toxin TNT-related protein [uncultured Shewanella sp.]
MIKETASNQNALPPQLHYVINDHAGSPRELCSEEGHVEWRGKQQLWEGFDSISNSRLPDRQYLEQAANDPVSCDLRYQGQVYDQETNLYYNRFRYYDPDSCQYLTPDPIGMAGGLRPSSYVHNPMEWVDPLGLAGAQHDWKKELDPQPDNAPYKKDSKGRWHDKKGKYVSQTWPPNEGFGTVHGQVIREKITIEPGHKLDRYGGWVDDTGYHDKGSYFSDVGAPFKDRALPPESLKAPYHQYEVIQPFEAEAGPIAPWFGEPGGATQYLVPKSEGGVDGLLDSGKIKRITKG